MLIYYAKDKSRSRYIYHYPHRGLAFGPGATWPMSRSEVNRSMSVRKMKESAEAAALRP